MEVANRVANNFVGKKKKANRKQLSGKFSTNDFPIKVSFLTNWNQTEAL